MRVTNSESPRFHIFYDMDFSPGKMLSKALRYLLTAER